MYPMLLLLILPQCKEHWLPTSRIWFEMLLAGHSTSLYGHSRTKNWEEEGGDSGGVTVT